MDFAAKLVDATEKVLRLILPGFVFLVLAVLAGYPEGKKPIEVAEKLLSVGGGFLVCLLGPVVYAVHRMFWEVIDYILYPNLKFNLATFRYQFPAKSPEHQNKDEGLTSFLTYKRSCAHLTLICAELLCVFSMPGICKDGSAVSSCAHWVMISGILLGVVSYWDYRLLATVSNRAFKDRGGTTYEDDGLPRRFFECGCVAMVCLVVVTVHFGLASANTGWWVSSGLSALLLFVFAVVACQLGKS